MIRQGLLEKVLLEGICRVFDVKIPWLLRCMNKIIEQLPEDLNADVLQSEELEISTLELAEQ